MPLTDVGRDFLVADAIGEAVTDFSNANGALGVGDSATAFAPSQTNLLGTRLRKGMDATYPQRAGAVVTARSTFLPAEANFAWAEWGWFNAVPDATGTMMSRVVQALGTKPPTQSWVITATLTFTNP